MIQVLVAFLMFSMGISSSASAASPVNPATPANIAEYIASAANRSPTLGLFVENLKLSPKLKTEITNALKERGLTNAFMPKASTKGDVITFSDGSMPINIKLRDIDKRRFLVNGKLIVISSTSDSVFKETFDSILKELGQKKSASLMDLLIPRAQAMPPALVVGAAAVIAGLGGHELSSNCKPSNAYCLFKSDEEMIFDTLSNVDIKDFSCTKSGSLNHIELIVPRNPRPDYFRFDLQYSTSGKPTMIHSDATIFLGRFQHNWGVNQSGRINGMPYGDVISEYASANVPIKYLQNCCKSPACIKAVSARTLAAQRGAERERQSQEESEKGTR